MHSIEHIYIVDFMALYSTIIAQVLSITIFKLEDIYASGKYQVNKIRIIPIQNDKLFSGFIYNTFENIEVFWRQI